MLVAHIGTKVSAILKTTNIEDYLLSLTGAAGTGKTFLTTQLAKYFIEKQKELGYSNNQDYSFVITAPTHKAVGVLADNMRKSNVEVSCKTIHSFLGIKPFIDYTTGEERFRVDKTKKTKDSASILMIDESSMVGSELYEYILEAIEEGRVGLVLFIGDPYQLLPVKDNENRIYKLQNQYTLTEVVRQAKGSYIINIASKLRDRIETQDFIDLRTFFKECREEYDELTFFHNKREFLNDFYQNDIWYDEDKILATHQNKNVDAFNKEIREKYWEEKAVHNPRSLLPGDKLRFKEAYSMSDVTLYHNGEVITLEKAEWKYHEQLQIEYWESKAVNSPQQQIFRVVDPDSMKMFNEKLTSIAKKADGTDDTITVILKDTVVVNLVSNPSTGYRWTYAENSAEKNVKFVSDVFSAPKTEMVGKAGTQTFSFLANKKGATIIEFNYARGTGTPANTHRVWVIVNKK